MKKLNVSIEPSRSDDVFDVLVNGKFVGELALPISAGKKMRFTENDTCDSVEYDDLCDICNAAKDIYTDICFRNLQEANDIAMQSIKEVIDIAIQRFKNAEKTLK